MENLASNQTDVNGPIEEEDFIPPSDGKKAKKTRVSKAKVNASNSATQNILSEQDAFLDVCIDKMREIGLSPKKDELKQGKQRCGTLKKPGGKDGSILLELDGKNMSCAYKNWSTGEHGYHSTKTTVNFINGLISKSNLFFDKEEKRRHAEAQKASESIWEIAVEATDAHPYLLDRQVPSLGLKKVKNNLLVPVYNQYGKIQSVQYILGKKDPQKTNKFFLPKSKKTGGFFTIPAKPGLENGPIMIGEGYATMASVHMTTGYECIVAFDCGNLLPVAQIIAQMIESKNLKREICICADNDCKNEKDAIPFNIGIEEATKAAKKICGCLAIPEAINDANTDFNDLWRAGKKETIKFCIENALQQNRFYWRDPYDVDEKGLFVMKKQGNSGIGEIKEYISQPIEILGKTRDGDSEDWGLLLSFKDGDSKLHHYALSKKDLQKNSHPYAEELAHLGYDIFPNQWSDFAKAMMTAHVTKSITTTTNIGWHNGSYVLPDAVYGPDKNIIYKGGIK